MSPRHRDIFVQVREALEPRLYEVLPRLLPGGRVQGREYICASILGGPGKSCSTSLTSGVGADFNTGERWGDVIDLARQVWKVTPVEAAEGLAGMFGAILSLPKKRNLSRNDSFKPASEPPLYIPIFPIPADAPPHPQVHYQRGWPEGVWCYRDEKGRPLHFVVRFESRNSVKEIIPLSLFRHIENDSLCWLWKALPAPRPLYNLDKLASASPDAPVLLVEGEKAADAASLLFPGYICMTWSGGAAMGRNADFSPIRERAVLIWPDNDAAGFRGAAMVAEMLMQLGNTPRLMLPPDTLPQRWDVADEPPQGFSPQDFLQSESYILSVFMERSSERYPDSQKPPTIKPLRLVALEEAVPQTAIRSPLSDARVSSWPQLGKEALPGFIGEFIGLATRESEADPAAVLATFLVRFGAEICAYSGESGPFVKVGETDHPPRLFVAVCGASSKARKGTSARPVLRLFQFTNGLGGKVLPAAFSRGPLSSGEGLAYRLRDKGNGEGEIDSNDRRLFLLDEELAAALASMRRDGNILSMTLRSFWDNGDYEPLTKNQQIRVHGAHLCLITHITIREVQRSLDTVQIFNGFANRFLWICSRRGKLVPRPNPMPLAEFSSLQTELWKRVRLAQARKEVSFTPAAESYWASRYGQLSEELPGLTGEITARAEAQCIRLALIYALVDGEGQIDVSHLISALAFWKYARDSALYIFGGEEEDLFASQILALLKTGSKSTTDIHSAFNGHMPGRKLKQCLQELVGHRLVVVHEEKTAGRPRTVYCLAEKERNEDKE